MKDVLRLAVEATLEMGGETIAPAGLDDETLSGLATICRKNNLRLLEPPLREHANIIHTGLTPANWAIAETGTLVVDSASENIRIASMLCELHVVFLDESLVLPDLDALGTKLGPLLNTTGGYSAFISGPSRTADIERSLTIGAHGPVNLHIHLMEYG
jgi:L-lactate dehydrogenase complex protein LldG